MVKTLHSPDGTAADKAAFGTMQFGGKASEPDAQAMIDACLQAGITHFDTAYVYTDGRSEQITGRALAAHRDRIVLATKVGYEGGAGRANLLAQFDICRQRLQMDTVDLLYLHRFDPDTDLRETLATFAELKDQNLIRYVGLSNFAAWQVMKAQSIGAEFDLSIDVLQPMYNLVKRQVEVEILPMCADQDIAVAAYSPLGGGLLTGKYAQGDSGRITENHSYNARYAQTQMHDAATELAALARARGEDPAMLAVAWVLSGRFDVMPIISGRSLDQLRPSLAALDYQMDPAFYDHLSGLFPAPPPATDRLEEA